MDGDLATTLVALAAFFVSAFSLYFTKVQAKSAALQAESGIAQVRAAQEAYQLSRQSAAAEAVMHFTDRFFDLLRAGAPKQLIGKDAEWTYLFWGLHSSEFYFFHSGVIPRFIYALWMVELANLYAGPDGANIWESHLEYLRIYSLNYQEMSRFFDDLHELATRDLDETTRNRKVAELIAETELQTTSS